MRTRAEAAVREKAPRAERGRLTLTIVHKKGKNDRFVATDVEFVAFSDDPGFKPGRKRLPAVDTARFTGNGALNGRDGVDGERRAGRGQRAVDAAGRRPVTTLSFGPERHERVRHRVIAAIVLVSSGLLAAACGSGGSGSNGGAAPPTTPTPPPAPTTPAIPIPGDLPPELSARSCSDESTLKSIDGATATSVVFFNARSSGVKIYWLNYSGQRQMYNTLNSAARYTQATFLTHPWVITDEAEQCVGIFLPTGQPGAAIARTGGSLPPAQAPQLTSSQAIELTGHLVSSGQLAIKQALQAGGITASSVSFHPRVSFPGVFNFPINNRQSCGPGGRIENTGSVQGSLDARGSGILQYQIRQTWTDCNVPLGGGKTLFTNGDPYLSQSGSITFINGVPATVNNGNLTGGLKTTILPDNITLSQCQNDISYTFPAWASPSFSATGSQACGVQLSAGVITLPPPLGPVDPNTPPAPPTTPGSEITVFPPVLDLGSVIANTSCGTSPNALTGNIAVSAFTTLSWSAVFAGYGSVADFGDYRIELAPASGTGSQTVKVTVTIRQVALTTGCHNLTSTPELPVIIGGVNSNAIATATVRFKILS